MSDGSGSFTPIHQWTHGGDKVLLVKCVQSGGLSSREFVWPKAGLVTTPNWSPEPNCESGGLFGWPWGLHLGGGKEPDYRGDWIVFAANPRSVIDLEDKAKTGPTAEVLFYGSWHGALAFTRAGRDAWLEHRFEACARRAVSAHESRSDADRGAATASGVSGAATASGVSGAATASGDWGAATASGVRGAATGSGDSGAATASGVRGAATASGVSGAATASGVSGAATASGVRGAATASGDCGAATASGVRGAATASGVRGAATASGVRGAATASGDRGAATASGDWGAATASGVSGAATASGVSGAATASGDWGAATASGVRGAATASGVRGAATASGDRGAAACTGEFATIEISGAGSAGLVTADHFFWIVRPGAVIFHRWPGGHAVLSASLEEYPSGTKLRVVRGEIIQIVSQED